MVAFDHLEVRVELLHRDDLGELRVDRDLVELCLAKFALEILVLLLQLGHVERLLFVLLVTQSQVIPQLLDNLQQLLFILGSGASTDPTLPLACCPSGCR